MKPMQRVGKDTYTYEREGLAIPKREGPPRWGPAPKDQVPAFGAGKIAAEEYISPQRYPLELDRVLRANWLLVCHSSEIPQAGDFHLYEAFGETILIVRQADGAIKAFHNVCRHRGARLVKQSGCGARGFVCPWHGFAYGLDGTLKGVRSRDGFVPEHLEGLRAIAVRVAEWGGFVFANISGDAPEFDAYLQEMREELAPYRLHEHRMADRVVFDIKANWKTVLDGFLELYHTPVTHASVDASAFRFDEGAYALFERHSMMAYPFVPRYEQLLATRDHQQFAGCHYLVFPNTLINSHAEHSEVYSIVPTGLDSTRLTAWRLLQQGAPPEFYERMNTGWKLFCGVIEEDAAVDAEVGATYGSSGFVDTFTHARECRILHFHEVVNRCLYGEQVVPARDERSRHPGGLVNTREPSENAG